MAQLTPYHKATPEKRALAKSLRDKKLPYTKIAKLLGISKPTAMAWAKEVQKLEPLAESYAQNRITLFRANQLGILSALEKDDLSEVPPQHKVKMVKDFWEMERVEAGKSTQNIGMAIFNLIQQVKERDAIDTEGREA